MKVLFIHQNFPGQFRHIALKLAADPAYQVWAVGCKDCPGMPGVRVFKYDKPRRSAQQTHQYVRGYEQGVLYGQAVVRVLQRIRSRRFVPDVIVAHPGWGETMFVREIFPNAKLIHFAEFFYHPSGADLGFDPEFPADIDDRARSRARNALHLLNLENCDVAISPTQWQKSVHPAAYQDKIRVLHEGVDTAYMRPNPEARYVLPNGTLLRAGDEVVTYVARNLEPMRGFHAFMRAIPSILEANPNCQIVIVGGTDVSYGSRPSDASNWKTKMLREVKIDPARVHFLGKVPYQDYRSILQISAAHVYLTYPFVLSWSMLEAMACGCVVIGSRTAPVVEVIEDQVNGFLFDFFDMQALNTLVSAALQKRHDLGAVRRAAASHVSTHYSVSDGVREYFQLLKLEANLES